MQVLESRKYSPAFKLPSPDTIYCCTSPYAGRRILVKHLTNEMKMILIRSIPMRRLSSRWNRSKVYTVWVVYYNLDDINIR